MSSQETKKAKRRKNKVPTGKYSATIPQANEVAEVVPEENGDAERIARLMDATDEVDILPAFNRGPNPFLDKEKCLFCGVDKSESVPSSSENSAAEDSAKPDLDGHTFDQLQVWVCQPCRNSSEGLHRSLDLKSVSEIPMPAMSLNAGQDITLETPSYGLMGEFNMFASGGEPTLANGSVCNCGSCLERRQIAQEYEQETKVLQTAWTDLRTMVRHLYCIEVTSLGEEETQTFRTLVDKLCSRDPHQLFQRLESQVRECVIEKKVNLRRKINSGFSTPPQAKEIMSMLLEEYNNVSLIARVVSENLSTLKEHLRRFNLTWELHNKHLYHSIVYTDPAIQGCLETLVEQLRSGALDKESYTEDTYPNLIKDFASFRNEMSVILVLWHDCQQLIDNYIEQQAAYKVKQKWLKEDWEFFKAQRKILEEQVLKNNPKASMPHSMEAQFTETMRNMLTGQKPSTEESHCARCSRKRCPCDECTITHMITCGIINPEQLESNGTHHTFNFPHDSTRYIIDVTPPSMSSTTSSSASSSPVPITREMAAHHLTSCNQSSQGNIQATEENSTRMDEGDDKEDEADDEDNDEEDEDNEEDDDDEDDEDDDEDEGDADEEEEEEEEEDEEDEGISEDQKEFDAMLASGKLGRPTGPVVVPSADSMKLWGVVRQPNQAEETLELSTQDFPAALPPSCACHHCVSPAQAQPTQEAGPEDCQCHICLQQRGQTVSTALPTSLPLPSQPSGLHLYPHIHGTLPATVAHPHLHMGHSHSSQPVSSQLAHSLERSLLQPQLYNLHGPRLPFKLDIEDSDAMHDHLMSAYGDWDNSSYDSTRMLGHSPHRFSTTLSPDLLPPPPMTSDPPFSLEALSPAVASTSHPMPTSHMMLGSTSVATTTSSAFKAVATGFATGIPPAFQIPAETFVPDSTPSSSAPPTSQPLHTSMVPDLNLRSTPLSSLPISFSPAAPGISSLPLPHTPPPPSTRPVTLGGNVGTSPTLGKEQRTYAQPCKKYTLSPQNSGFGVAGKVGVAPPPPAPPSSHNHMNVSMSNGVPSTPGKVTAKSRLPVPSSQPAHTCNHSQHMVHSSGGEGQAEGHAGHAGHGGHASHAGHAGHAGHCSSASALPTTINNVSVGTSTLCTDPDCQSHHDDNCDSVDDSCSEKSSSTSASTNQKEGKYCDCCYCEFFGHGNPPVVQTSKNYAEMRERLRRRLKQRQSEAKQDGESSSSQVGSQHSAMDHKNLEELLKFINGTDSEGAAQQSSRAAKRARQKQRKAEERLRLQQEEERRQKLAAQRLAEEARSNNCNGQKKKVKHKEDRQQKDNTPVSEESNKVNAPKVLNKGKQRLKDGPSDSQPDKVGGPTQEASSTTTKGKVNGVKTEAVRSSAPSLTVVNKTLPASPVTSNRDTKKSVEVFQPPAHLMRSLAEHTLQQVSLKTSPPPVTSSPGSMPTLGNQPNSPTAKKAKRRLAPGGSAPLSAQRKLVLQQPPDLQQCLLQIDEQRRIEAQQEVAKQMKEAEEFAQQRLQMRTMNPSQLHSLQQAAHSMHLQEQQRQEQERLEQEKQKQQKQAQEKQKQEKLKQEQEKQKQAQKKKAAVPQAQPNKPQPSVQVQPATPNTPSKQAGPGKPGGAVSQGNKPSTNGVLPQHSAANHGKMANGVVVSKTSQSCPPSPAAGCGPSPTKPVSSSAKTLPAGSNGLMNQAQMAMTAENRARLANSNMAQKNNAEQLEQAEQGKNAKGKNKKKKKASQDIRAVDEVFMPRPEMELESNDMDEADRDIEKFKRFVMENPTPPRERQKLDINLNMKDIFSKKKSGLGCS